MGNVTSCVESISVVDMLDVSHDLDVSLDCACSAEIVYYIDMKPGKDAVMFNLNIINSAYLETYLIIYTHN